MAINVMTRVIRSIPRRGYRFLLTVWCQNDGMNTKGVVEVVVVNDASVVKMSGGDVDVKPYLNSRNSSTTRNRNSNSQSKIGPTLLELVLVSGGFVCGIRWCYAEVVEVCRSICGHQNKIWRNMDGKRVVDRT